MCAEYAVKTVVCQDGERLPMLLDTDSGQTFSLEGVCVQKRRFAFTACGVHLPISRRPNMTKAP